MIEQENYIQREEYLNQLISYKNKPLIKVVTGIRRCGKSTLLELYQNYLLKSGITPKQIISINLESLEFSSLCDYMALYNYIKERLCSDKFTYVFIDEVQKCNEFQRAVDSLFVMKNIDVYITGSNAYMLSGELATLLSGRYVTIEMLPLSFKEYADGINLQDSNSKNVQECFRDYLRFGSFPLILQFGNDENQIRQYLDGLYTTIFKKDIVTRNRIKDEMVLEDITKFIYDNIGNITSAKKISDSLTSFGRKTTQPTVERYLSFLTDSYMVYQVDRYDIKGKQYLKSLSKYYAVDMGLRNYLLGYKDSDYGHVLENIIFLQLLRKGFKVHVGKVGETEVDFVATRQFRTVYIQVADTVRDKVVFEREMAPLRSIKNFHERILITNDYDMNENYDGIKHYNAIDFLLDKYAF